MSKPESRNGNVKIVSPGGNIRISHTKFAYDKQGRDRKYLPIFVLPA